MARLVVITRPYDEAAILAAELQRQGYRTLIEPMLEILPLPTPIPPLAQYSALAFTSANGVRAFADRCAERSLPAYAVGTRTALALHTAGFTMVRDAGGDAESLAVLIRETAAGQGPVLHVAGKDVARNLAELLRPAAIQVDKVALYDAVPTRQLSPALAQALYACTIRDVLFFSVRTAATFGTLLRELGLTDMVAQSSALCLSDSVAAEAARLPWRQIKTAAHPTTKALTDLLDAPDV